MPSRLLMALTVFFVAAFVLTTLAVRFWRTIFDRLSVRIALLILITGPLIAMTFLLFNAVYYGSFGQPAPWWSRLIQMFLLLIGTPLVMGLLAARFVTTPLKHFTEAIQALKLNGRPTPLGRANIREFDQVFSEFNELIARLHEEEELRKHLISDAAHELNTPLTALLAQIDGMQQGVIPKDTTHLETLHEQAERLKDTSEQLVAYARLQSQMLQPAMKSVDVAKLVQTVAAAEQPMLKAAGMRLDTELQTPTVLGDEKMLKQLLTNLVQNAVRYSGGKTLHITADADGISIADNGHGVPPAALPYLFERFYRVEGSRNRATGGLGLGLAIVKEIVEAHGWHIVAEDAQPGLKFIIRFTPSSQPPALLRSMKLTTTSKTIRAMPKRGLFATWLPLAVLCAGLVTLTCGAVQQNYRQSANDPQIQMAEDAAAAWRAGAAPRTLVGAQTVNAATSLAPFTVILDKQLNVLASNVTLNGTTPMPPRGVYPDASKRGELRFTWQTASGLRFATVVDPTPDGYVVAARSLKEVEGREQRLELWSGAALIVLLTAMAAVIAIVN